jgi:hypothetical protein
MGMSAFYGSADEEEAVATSRRARELGGSTSSAGMAGVDL